MVRKFLISLAVAGVTIAFAGTAALAQIDGEVPRGTYKKYDGNTSGKPPKGPLTDDDLVPPLTRPPEFGPWYEIGGRKVRVVTRMTRAGAFLGRTDYGLLFYGLEDDNGKVLLPVVFKNITLGAGGIYVRSYLGPQLFERYDLKTGIRTPIPGLVRVTTRGLGGKRFDGAVLEYAGEEVSVTLPIAPRRYDDAAPDAPRVPKIKTVALGRVEVLDAGGQVAMVYDRLAPMRQIPEPPLYGSNVTQKVPSYIQNASDFWVMGLVTPTGGVATQVLDADFRAAGKVLPWATSGGSLGYVVPAPDVPDAWVRVTPGGLSAPEGALAYRPLGDGVMSEAGYIVNAYENDGNYQGYRAEWLVAYPSPDGKGIAWGYLDKASKAGTGPLWREVVHIQSELVREGWALIGPTIAVQTMNGKWRIMSKSFPELEGPEYSDPDTLIAAREKLILALRENDRKREQAMADATKVQAQSELERRRERWRWLTQTGQWQERSMMAEQWGGEFFVAYIDGHPYPSVAEVERAIGLTGDPAISLRLAKKLEEAKAREVKYAEIQKKAEEEVARDRVRRATQGSSFQPDYSGYTPTDPAAMTQALINHNAAVNSANCAVADKGGIRSCTRN